MEVVFRWWMSSDGGCLPIDVPYYDEEEYAMFSNLERAGVGQVILNIQCRGSRSQKQHGVPGVLQVDKTIGKAVVKVANMFAWQHICTSLGPRLRACIVTSSNSVEILQ